jgi:hypothetical protein
VVAANRRADSIADRVVPELNEMRRVLWTMLAVTIVGSLYPAHRASSLGDSGADGRFERRVSFHFTLYQDVDVDESSGVHGSRHFEQRTLQELENAYDLLGALLEMRPERKIDVYVWDAEIFAERFQGLFRFPAAGFYGGAIHIRGDERVTPALVRVLHHELVHAAFDAEAPRLGLPAWMNEGIAEWFEARALGKRSLSAGERSVLVRAAKQQTLFRLNELAAPSFGNFSPDAAALAYLQSYGFIDHLVDSHGERRLVQFCSAVVRTRDLDRGVKRAYRKDLADLEKEYRRALGAR